MKIVLTLAGLVGISVLLTSICILNGLEPWQIFLANCGAGALLGFASGLWEYHR